MKRGVRWGALAFALSLFWYLSQRSPREQPLTLAFDGSHLVDAEVDVADADGDSLRAAIFSLDPAKTHQVREYAIRAPNGDCDLRLTIHREKAAPQTFSRRVSLSGNSQRITFRVTDEPE